MLEDCDSSPLSCYLCMLLCHLLVVRVGRATVIEREDGGDYDLMRAEQRPRGGAGQVI